MTIVSQLLLLLFACAALCPVLSWAPPISSADRIPSLKAKATDTTGENDETKDIFEEFVSFLRDKQTEIVETVETMDGATAKFSNDTWGLFDEEESKQNAASGGITRVIQGGNVVEKGACSLTVIRRGVLSVERAAAIRSRQDSSAIQPGDAYSAAALSIVFHSRSPMIPTFRSDVRIFLVESSSASETLAFFGGGADLTPYYLYDEDVSFFHGMYRDLCEASQRSCDNPEDAALFSYPAMKDLCDQYFYLHAGTTSCRERVYMPASTRVADFVRSVANAWMPSWLPIVEKRRKIAFTDKQKQWQMLRRGRYLEFNLLYGKCSNWRDEGNL